MQLELSRHVLEKYTYIKLHENPLFSNDSASLISR